MSIQQVLGKIPRSPYLKPNRVGDILAAIQAMALYHNYRLNTADWGALISGDENKTAYWKEVFDDHPEFFRRSTSYPDHYALVWRRALSRRYHRRLRREVTQEEYAQLSDDEKKQVSRAPVPETHIKTLFDTATELHQRAVDAHRDWRWWVAPAVTGVCSFGGAILGGLLRH